MVRAATHERRLFVRHLEPFALAGQLVNKRVGRLAAKFARVERCLVVRRQGGRGPSGSSGTSGTSGTFEGFLVHPRRRSGRGRSRIQNRGWLFPPPPPNVLSRLALCLSTSGKIHKSASVRRNPAGDP
jgi:hypothetical protein